MRGRGGKSWEERRAESYRRSSGAWLIERPGYRVISPLGIMMAMSKKNDDEAVIDLLVYI